MKRLSIQKQEFNVEEFTLIRKKGVYILMTS